MTFNKWCKQQLKREDAVGDFARDFLADKCGRRLQRPMKIMYHLAEVHNAIPGARYAFTTAWGEYHLELTGGN